MHKHQLRKLRQLQNTYFPSVIHRTCVSLLSTVICLVISFVIEDHTLEHVQKMKYLKNYGQGTKVVFGKVLFRADVEILA